MKTKNLIIVLSIAAITAGLSGCGKKEAAPPKPEETKATAGTVSDTLKDAANTAATEVKKVAEEVKATAEKTVTDATKQVESLTTTATSKAQEYIDKAKAFVNEQKYQDALAALRQLGNMSLSPEQQKAVNDLKRTIQTSLGTSAATNALNNLFGK